jgi:hypothetical protein
MADEPRTIGDLFRRLVQHFASKYDFSGLYPARVVSQNADGSLELRPDDPDRFGLGLSRVPLRLGLPGVAVKVRKDSRVLLSFEGFDPQRPIATLWDAASAEELTFTCEGKVIVNAPKVFLGDEENAQPVACLGDVVEVVFPPTAVLTGTVGGAPLEAVAVVADSLLGIISTTRATKTKAS